MTNQTINARNLVTEYLRNIELPSDFDLPFLGTENLKFLANYYIQKEANTASKADSFQSETNPSEANENPLLQEEDEELYRTIDTIIASIDHAESKPLLATLRSDQWFNIGDEVMCFIQDNGNKTLLKKNTFVTGKVIAGRKYHEDYVSVFTNEKIHTGNNQDRHRLNFTIRDPCVMKIGEYNYLKNHPDYLKMWITNYSTLLQFNPEPMLQAFAEQ